MLRPILYFRNFYLFSNKIRFSEVFYWIVKVESFRTQVAGCVLVAGLSMGENLFDEKKKTVSVEQIGLDECDVQQNFYSRIKISDSELELWNFIHLYILAN